MFRMLSYRIFGSKNKMDGQSLPSYWISKDQFQLINAKSLGAVENPPSSILPSPSFSFPILSFCQILHSFIFGPNTSLHKMKIAIFFGHFFYCGDFELVLWSLWISIFPIIYPFPQGSAGPCSGPLRKCPNLPSPLIFCHFCTYFSLFTSMPQSSSP